MIRLSFLFLLTVLSSCALTSKYKINQHSVYARMLTDGQKDTIKQKGELFLQVTPKDSLTDKRTGVLRVLRTDNAALYNFFEVGPWTVSSRYGNSGSLHNVAALDSVTYDLHGNIVQRRFYDKANADDFHLVQRWTAHVNDTSFIQRIEIYQNDKLVSELSQRVLNFDEPKSDILKKKVLLGTRRDYFSDGKLRRTITYGVDGKPIAEKKYSR